MLPRLGPAKGAARLRGLVGICRRGGGCRGHSGLDTLRPNRSRPRGVLTIMDQAGDGGRRRTAVVTGASSGIGEACAEVRRGRVRPRPRRPREDRLRPWPGNWRRPMGFRRPRGRPGRGPEAASEVAEQVKGWAWRSTPWSITPGSPTSGRLPEPRRADAGPGPRQCLCPGAPDAVVPAGDGRPGQGWVLNVASTAAFVPGPADGHLLREQGVRPLVLRGDRRRGRRVGRHRHGPLPRPDRDRVRRRGRTPGFRSSSDAG